MAEVRNSGSSGYQAYDYEAESKKAKGKKKERVNNNAQAAKNAGKTAKLLGKAVAVGAENFGGEGGVEAAALSRELGEQGEHAGNIASTAIQTAGSDSLTAAGTSTLALAGEANKAYKDVSAKDSAFTEAGQKKAYSDAAKKEGAKAASLEGKVAKAAKNNPDVVGKDETIDTSTSAGKRAYRQAARADDLRAKEKTYAERAGGLNARAKPDTKKS